ncbi:unnamed protein product [Rotaria sp. Silwood1]|nr:unnamed protein product [Rotaria sp. Silwood1]
MPEKIHLSLFDVLLVPSLLAASSRKTIPTETVNDPTLLKIVRIRRAVKATTKAATTKAATTKAATTAAATTAAVTTIAINNSSTTTSSTNSLFEQQAMTQTNIDRANYCVAPLTIDPNVTAIARNYSQQPLLNASSQFSIGNDDDGDNGNRTELLKNSFSDWQRIFSRKKIDNKYMQLNDDAEDNDNDEAVVSVCKPYRFCPNVYFYVFGAGIFVIESFSDHCDDLQQNFTTPVNNSNTYSQGINLNIFNSGVPHKLHYNNTLILSSTLPMSSPSFREEVMDIVRWLFSKYARALDATRWSIIRQGAIFGVFTGWLCMISYLAYSVGFIFGSLFMSHKPHHSLSISDILVGNDTSVNEPDVWKDDAESSSNINGDVEFDNVDFIYPSRKEAPVLHNLSLVARVGRTTALVGSSGCGKSTCMSLFLRYYEPSSGRITIDGRPITDYNVKQLRENIGIVSQEPILFNMSIYENIRFGKVNASREEIEQAAREANAHHFIMQLPDKYETVVGECGVQLSGGEKQRIALARALVKKPTFLLLDEATSALDNVSEKIVQEALDRACNGRTTIAIAHRLATIKNAHQIYVLDKGSVIEQGTHETLISKEGGKYQAMVKRQQMEGIYDNQDDRKSIQKAIEEDEKSILERSRLISDSETVDTNKQITKPFRQRFVFLRLLSMNSPEWITISIGCIACVLNGAAQPLFAFLLVKIIEAFKYCSNSERRHHVLIASLLFLLLGGVVFIFRFFQYTAFAISGSKLTQRIRSKAFACLLRQEVAYFDRPENSSGAICTRLSSGASAIQEMTDGFALAFLYWRGLILVENNELTSNHIITAFAIATFTIQTLKVLGLISNNIATSVSAAQAFFDLFDREPAIDNTSTEGQKIVNFCGEIIFDQVKFIYPSRPTSFVLNKLQLKIKPSQHVALVGKSGCGKSTIIQLLERFYDVTSGGIFLDGINIRKLNPQWVRSQFGLVSQEPILFDLTIAENIAYGLENVPTEDIINAAIRANVHQFIEQLPQGYETKVGFKGSFLSGGEKQRIAIARILLRRPKVLLLDEATSAMDSHNEQVVQEALEQAQREDPNRTSLIIAHRLSTIRTCDLICVLDRGHIVESGNHVDLTQQRGAYYKMLARDKLQ